MQAAEALTRLIAMGDELLGLHPSQRPANEDKEREELAITIAQAMLNSMIPVARYRVHVEIDAEQPLRKSAEDARAVHEEFTACATQMHGILGALIGITMTKTNVRVSLWEQRPTGADMISGYQGPTKCLAYKTWLQEIVALETMPTVQ